ncbi:MAG: hypothetical protein HY866_21195 [Chloroflexi bacterium]|nr:hypothetical protein [Chloroflexota bacterium]
MITSLVFLIERISFGLYILNAAGILAMARRLQLARRSLLIAQFKLEREHALVRQATAITFGGLLIEFTIGVWAVANLMAPTLRDIRVGENQGPQIPDRLETSTPASNPPVILGAGGAPVEEGDVPFATPIPTATAVGTLLPDAPEMVGCPRDKAWLLVPGNGQRLFEATTAWGTASISNFAFYRFEIKPMVAGAEFAPLGGDYTSPVVEGPLGDIFPPNLDKGDYRFRLVVFDNTQMARAVCEVTIYITESPPTPTSNVPAAPTSAPAE